MKSLKPQRLVYEENNVFHCDSQGLELLCKLAGPLGVIAVTGRYRGGKSFLTNRAILGLGPKQGFQTGSSVNACTKGIWVIPGFLKEGIPTAVVLDTEGSGSLDATRQQDTNLLSIAVALSSILVFNSIGALDEGNFSEISILAHAARSLQSISSDVWTPPELIWTLRDFALELKTACDEEMSPNQYLEHCLNDEDRGETRAILRSYFPHRFLVPFVRPVHDESKLQKLNSLGDKELRPEFIQDMQNFKDLVSKRLQPKKVGACSLSGEGLAHLCRSAVNAVNSGKTPSVHDTFTFMLESELKQSIEDAKKRIQAEAFSLSKLIPCAPEVLKLSLPSAPDFLSTYDEFTKRYNENMAAICKHETDALTQRNSLDQKKWIKDFLKASTRGQEEYTFSAYLEGAPNILGDRLTLETMPLMLDATRDGIQCQIVQVKQELESTQKHCNDLTAEYSECKAECNSLREDLEHALVEYSGSIPKIDHSESERYRINSECIFEDLEQCMNERDSEIRKNTELRAELSDLQESMLRKQAESSGERGKESEELSSRLEKQAEEYARNLRLAAEDFEAQETERLQRLRTEMIEQIEFSKQKVQTAELQKDKEMELLSENLQALSSQSQAQILEEVALSDTLKAIKAESIQAETEYRTQLSETKRRQTEILSENAKKMKTSHEESSQEIRRLQQQALDTERTLVRLDVENQSLKRSAEVHKDDLIHLAKARQGTQELREQLYEKESELRAAESTIRDCRLRLASQEVLLREQQQTHMTTCRDKDYRIALLEVQLSSQI